MSAAAVGHMFGVNESAVWTIKKEHTGAIQVSVPATAKCRITWEISTLYINMKNALFIWMECLHERGVVVDSNLIWEKALSLFKMMCDADGGKGTSLARRNFTSFVTISCFVICLSAKMMLWIIPVVSCVVMVTCLPGQGLSSRFFLICENAVSYFFYHTVRKSTLPEVSPLYSHGAPLVVSSWNWGIRWLHKGQCCPFSQKVLWNFSYLLQKNNWSY